MADSKPPHGKERGHTTDPSVRPTDAVLRFEVDRARELLHRGRPLIGRMPRALAVDVDLFSRGGLAILDR